MGFKKRYRKDGQYAGDAKVQRKQAKTEYKTSKVESKANLAMARGYKRKWLAILVIALITGYLILKGAGSGILENIPFLGENK